MSTDEDFSSLLRRARAGDDDAWEAIFSRLGDERGEGAILLAMARKVLPRGDGLRKLVSSRDLLQSALQSGWFNLDNFRGTTEQELLGWLRTILRRKMAHVIRKKRTVSVEDVEAAAPAEQKRTGQEQESPFARVVREEAKTRVRQAVKQLPDDQRAVMELRLQGHKSPEIARILDLTEAAVRKRESRATSRLRELLGEKN